MLPAAHRMRRSHDFGTAVRGGRRAGRELVVVHLWTPAQPGSAPALDGAVTVGVVVSRAVGGAVVRNRVKRRLRALLRSRIDAMPPGCMLVVRALPAAGKAPQEALAEDLDGALRSVLRPRGGRT